MAKAKRAKPAAIASDPLDIWFTLQQLAEFLERGAIYLNRDVIPKLADADANKSERAFRYRLRAVVAVMLKMRGRRGGDGSPEAEADPLLAGPASPALERYRAARADAAEMEVAQRRGDLLPREKWESSIETIVGPVKRAAAKSCPDCQRRLNEALERVQADVARIG